MKQFLVYVTSVVVVTLGLSVWNNHKETVTEASANAGLVYVAPQTTVVTNTAPKPVTEDNSFEGPKEIHNISITPDNTVLVLGEIGEGSIDIAQDISVKAKKNKDVYVLINGPGGSVLDGAQIVSAIQASKATVHTVCLQLCASMSSIIHAYGHERLMVDRAILMNHQAALGLQGPVEIVRSRLNTLYRYTQKMDSYIAKRAGLTLEQFNAIFVSEQWIDAEDATAQHFNDKIVSLDLSSFAPNAQTSVKESITKTKMLLNMKGF